MDQTEPFEEPCFYCGLPGISTDHVIPQSVMTAARNSGEVLLIAAIENPRRRRTVPACRECNSIAGGVLDDTLADRKERVQARLRVRYRKLLAIPDWTPRNYWDLEPWMRDMVMARIIQRDQVRRRIAW